MQKSRIYTVIMSLIILCISTEGYAGTMYANGEIIGVDGIAYDNKIYNVEFTDEPYLAWAPSTYSVLDEATASMLNEALYLTVLNDTNWNDNPDLQYGIDSYNPNHGGRTITHFYDETEGWGTWRLENWKSENDEYPAEQIYNDGDWTRIDWTSNFATVNARWSEAPPTPTPEPATLLLFGTGLAGLVGVGRRKRRK